MSIDPLPVRQDGLSRLPLAHTAYSRLAVLIELVQL